MLSLDLINKIMKKILTSVLLISLIAISCKKEETAVIDETSTPSNAITADTIITNNLETVPQDQVQTATPSMMVQPNTTAKGINPPHGQPGHRCEIPVGAPLDSAPMKTTQQAQPTTPIMSTSNVQTSNAVTAPGMNPPHGQAGHTCSVPVGAPLPKTN
jgi:hypothetical protein